MSFRTLPRHVVFLCASLFLLSGCQELFNPAPRFSATQPASDRMREVVTYLASDELEGRGVDTDGINKAADFIVARMKSSGLRPVRGAVDGYFQPFKMRGETRIEDQTHLQIGESDLKLHEEYRPLNFSASKPFAGGVTFVGYAARSPDHEYDDLEGLDLTGRVALAMRYEPHNPAGKSRFSDEGWSEQGSLVTKAENAAQAGAVALLLVNPPNHHGKNDQLVPFGRRFSNQPMPIPVIHITRKVADELLAQGGVRDLKTLQELIDAEGRPASAELADRVVIRGEVLVRTRELDVKNVVAALPGRGRSADEWIVIGAHYDHLGYGGRQSFVGGDQRVIHNGADDNASGTAAVIELAERFVRRPPAQRSLLFIFFTAEESGLLGSEHFVNNPLVPLDQIVAMINLDMVGRVKNDDIIIGGRETAPRFESVVAEADMASPLRVRQMTGMVFGSSDHASFMKKQIPSLFLFSGLHADYHRPTDDADKINYEGMALAVDMAEDIIRRVAVLPRQPYVAMRPATRPASTGPARDPNMESGRPQLGIIPGYTDDQTSDEGVLVTGTTPGTAAADAGLKQGDVLQAIDGRKMRTLEDLVEFLQTARVGQKIRMTVLREGQPMELETTLKARE